MTQIREKTLEMLERLPDEKIIYIFNILQNIEAFSSDEKEQAAKEEAFATLMNYSRSLSADFDYKAELEAARMEKYGSVN